MIHSMKIATCLRNNNVDIVINLFHKKTSKIHMLGIFITKLHYYMFAYIHMAKHMSNNSERIFWF